MTFQVQDIPGCKPLDPERLKALCPFYHVVPKDLAGNVRWREKILERAQDDGAFADSLFEACSRDPLFFINTFCFTLDILGDSRCSVVPFVTWRSQDQVVLEIVEAIRNYDLWCEKSRCQGFTWLVMMVFLWEFLFSRDRVLLGCASKTAELVDDASDPSSLMPKLDAALDWLPEFLKPTMSRVSMKLVNGRTGSLIRGYSTTEDIARGGRLHALFCDEFASFYQLARPVLDSSTAVTKCRIFGSTHKGTGTEFYRYTRPTAGKKVVRVHWTSNPRQARGLYTADARGKLQILDEEFRGHVQIEDRRYHYPDEYPFILDGKIRSPYYDNECSRLGNDKVSIARELDINPEESGAAFFPAELVDRMAVLARKRVPLHVGDVVCDWQTGDFISFSHNPAGIVKLWADMDIGGRLPKAEYVLGIDVSTGAGDTMASNSVISIANKWLKEKVGEVVTAKLTPDRFAVLACAIGRWLSWEGREAFVIWEENGPGKMFKRRLLELGYSSFYKRRHLDKIGEPGTDQPGWWSSTAAKMTIMGQLRTAYDTGNFVNPSVEAIEELRHYQYDPEGGTSHSGTIYCENPTKSKKNHGDRVVADALMWDQVRGRTPEQVKSRVALPEYAPEGSLAYRRQERREEKLAEARW